MVLSVKISLKNVLGQGFCNFEELTSLLTEVEAVVNSRPHTCQFNEAPEPEHFLVAKRLAANPHSSRNRQPGATARESTRRLKYRQALFKVFCIRWQKEYLSSPRSAHHARQSQASALEVNFIVVVHANLASSSLESWKNRRSLAVGTTEEFEHVHWNCPED